MYDKKFIFVENDLTLENSREICKEIQKQDKYKNSFSEISLTDYYEEKNLPKVYILLAKNIEGVIPKYKPTIAAFIIERILENKFTILPVTSMDIVKVLYKDTVLPVYIQKYSLLIRRK